MSKDWGLGEPLFLQEHWEWESARVLGIDLFDLDLSVGEVVVKNIVLVATVVGSVLPQDVEAEHLPVVVEEALESFVWSASLKHDLDVVLNLSLVRWGLLIINHCSGVGEQVVWICLRGIKWASFLLEESLSEIITVNNSENSAINVEISRQIEIAPAVVLVFWVFWEWELVSLQENSLWDTGVLNLWLNDVDGIVLEVIVDKTFSNSEILIGIFNYWLLEVSMES